MECSIDHKEHHLMKVKHLRKFFLKSFLVSLIILILSYLLMVLMCPYTMTMVENVYGLEADDYAKICLILFGLWKILIIQFTLVPFIVFAMVERHLKEKISKEAQ